mmetsp:Transcript_79488/g.221191  ORF Transcript_79488/g.221191 Transcript_79488/m.221191 type:complete len:239 (-) Transcript_79488:218-934(-)
MSALPLGKCVSCPLRQMSFGQAGTAETLVRLWVSGADKAIVRLPVHWHGCWFRPRTARCWRRFPDVGHRRVGRIPRRSIIGLLGRILAGIRRQAGARRDATRGSQSTPAGDSGADPRVSVAGACGPTAACGERSTAPSQSTERWAAATSAGRQVFSSELASDAAALHPGAERDTPDPPSTAQLRQRIAHAHNYRGRGGSRACRAPKLHDMPRGIQGGRQAAHLAMFSSLPYGVCGQVA